MEAQPQPEAGEPEVFNAPEIAAIRNQVQIALAKVAFKDLDPRSALKNFIGNPDAPDSLAAHFSDYVADPAHAHDHVDVNDPKAVAELLEAIRNYKKDTLH